MDIDPRAIERRIVYHYMRGLQIQLYNLISLSLGRYSSESETMKNIIKKEFTTIRKQAYRMLEEELREKGSIGEEEINGILEFSLPYKDLDNDTVSKNMRYWDLLDTLISVVFKTPEERKKAKELFTTETIDYLKKAMYFHKRDFKEAWDGAEEYLSKSGKGVQDKVWRNY